MEIHEIIQLAVTFACGLLGGGVYFTLLWRSIEKFKQGGYIFLFILSTFFRLLLLLAFLYIVARNDFLKYLVFMAAFFVSKLIAVRVSKKLGKA